jgi:hypothetical protein
VSEVFITGECGDSMGSNNIIIIDSKVLTYYGNISTLVFLYSVLYGDSSYLVLCCTLLLMMVLETVPLATSQALPDVFLYFFQIEVP